MATTVTKGIFSEECGFPAKPPAEMEATCHHCFSLIKTEEIEEKLRVVISINKNKKSAQLTMGWKIPCPECRRWVFFPYLCEKTSRKVLQIIYNQHRT